MESFLGIEIGGTKLQIVAGDGNGRIYERRRFSVIQGLGAAGIRQQLEKSLPALIQTHKPGAIGVGFGGPVDWKTGRICRSHQIEGWPDFDLSGWFQSFAGLPAIAENDANVAALAEATHGAGKGANPVFFVTLGSGVGGGLVVDAKIYHGALPGESEIGHIRLDRKGTTLESRCSGWAADKRIRDAINAEPHSVLARLAGDTKGAEAAHLAQALVEGDASAQKIITDVAEDLAFGLSHAVHLFHPQVIVLGGGLSKVGEPLRTAIEKHLPGFVMEALRPGLRIVLGALGEDAVPMGALMLASRL
jgi:glucokinase